MPYLTLSGVTVPVAVDSVSMSYEDVGGEQERSPSGELTGGPLVSKREWRMTTTPLPVSEVDAWVGLIEGKGHTFPFDVDLYSTRGRGNSSGTGVLDTVTKKYGAASLEVANLTSITWALGLGTTWTVVAWTNDQGGGGWKHRVLRSDAVEWVNGALLALNVGEISVSSGSLVFEGVDGTDWLFDDTVALPYEVPASWPAAMYAHHSASAWSALPRVTAGGSFATASVTVRGKVTGSKVIRCRLGGALTSGYLLDFTLREV